MAESNQTKIVRLETQMTSVEQKVDKLDAKMDNVITKLDSMALLDNEIKGLQAQIIELKNSRVRNNLLYPTLAAICGAVISGLIILVIAGK